jgi:hypothetical protein
MTPWTKTRAPIEIIANVKENLLIKRGHGSISHDA